MENKEKIYENEPVSKLLGGLKHVEAPNDFDFRVKARIADGKPTDRATSWLPAPIRYAVPLALLMVVGGYFAFNAYYSKKNVDVHVAETETVNNTPLSGSTPNKDTVLPPDQLVVGRNEVKSPETETKGLTKEPEKKGADINRPGGSLDEAGRAARKIYPRGFDPNSATPISPKGFEPHTQISVKEILTIVGIKSAFTADGWKAESISSNSIADHAGVKAGDVIEAINDQALTEKTAFGNKFNGKSLRVRRGGATMQIVLKN